MPSPERDWLLAEHRRRNLQTLDAAEHFQTHRAHAMQLLMQFAGTPPGKLCVLGAGNCNDLNLPELLSRFREICLVDLDRAAPELAVARRLSAPHLSRVHVAASTDVTGIYRLLQTATENPDIPLDSGAVLTLLAAAPPQFPGAPFDCVVSGCLLSQLIDSAQLALGANHASLFEVILALREQHLRTLVQTLAPGGRGLLISDFVSSQSLPQLMQIEASRLAPTLLQAIAAKNFFTGLNPFAIQNALQTNPQFAGTLADIQLHHPWRWDIGRKQFAVFAISFQKTPACLQEAARQ
jgi:hypothetical protein